MRANEQRRGEAFFLETGLDNHIMKRLFLFVFNDSVKLAIQPSCVRANFRFITS